MKCSYDAIQPTVIIQVHMDFEKYVSDDTPFIRNYLRVGRGVSEHLC